MLTLTGSILRHGVLRARQTAIIDDRAEYSYGKLLLGTWHMATQIEKQTQNAHVGIMLPPSGAFPMALLGTWLLGRTAVPLNYLLSEDASADILDFQFYLENESGIALTRFFNDWFKGKGHPSDEISWFQRDQVVPFFDVQSYLRTE